MQVLFVTCPRILVHAGQLFDVITTIQKVESVNNSYMEDAKEMEINFLLLMNVKKNVVVRS